AYLCTGNHDWSDPAFGLILGAITLGNGSWVGARALLAPGVSLGDSAVAGAGSVVTKSIPAGEIHAGNPAVFARHRSIRRTSDTNSTPVSESRTDIRAASELEQATP
ncbi:MAG: hypothetical protein M3Z85_21455, partial [Acidobacteriota bacterium]|nr:hypothetical protein [Acidobacteriota bacterium]